ncbi:hypothetical protein ACU8DI_12145 [Psychroserpens sp. BH13MA-6]
MKPNQLLFFVFVLSFQAFSQEFKIEIPPLNDEITIVNNGETVINTDNEQLNTITILASNLSAGDYVLSSDQLSSNFIFNTSNNKHLVTFNALESAVITISKGGSIILTSKIKLNIEEDTDDGVADDDSGDTDKSGIFKTPETIIQEYFPDLAYEKRLGYYIPENNSGANFTTYYGKDYVHIFLDGFGNSILNAIPQGSPEVTYIVHIITSIKTENMKNVRYSVKQTAGDIDDILVFRNTGKLDNFIFEAAGEIYDYYHSEYALRESNKDITFEVYKGVTDGAKTVNTKLNTLTIPIKIYNGSFDIGLLKSDLSNPTFTFSASATDPNLGNVKRDESGSRGMVTAMATFYGSPVLAFKRFILGQKEQVPDYKLTGRNYVSDHKLFERIYPAVGLSINDNTFENIFYGFNWEVVKGASLFAGWHYGKINDFEISDENFQFESYEISKQQFDLATKQKWDTDFAIGVNLDVLVILNLLQKGATNK